MVNDRSSLDSDDTFDNAGRTGSPMGGGGTTNIGGGTSGAAMGNADTQRSNTSPIDDITATDIAGDTDVPSGISDRSDADAKRPSKS
ncbi:MAG: hypothetical protein H0U81_01150 [Pyrinomonadaceae bacterium]|nr:hypothetical protein [Pyrinomonadaceae bacterium]